MEERARIQLARVSLGLTALVFAGFGVLFAVKPEAIEAVGVVTESVTAQIEIRAYYGGLGLGLGVFFGLAAARTGWHRPALFAQIATFGGLAAGRVAGMIAAGTVPVSMALFAAVEAAGAALGVAATLALFGGRRDVDASAPRG